jgi:adenine-specific DNA glycosylase
LKDIPDTVVYFPKKIQKKKPKDIILSVCVFFSTINNEKSFLLIKRPPKGLLANQWEFPNVELKFTELNEGENDTSIKETIDKNIFSFSSEKLWETFPSYISNVLGFNWLDSSHESADLIPENGLPTIFTDSNGIFETLSEPILHIFSHQRHTMYIFLREINLMNYSLLINSKHINQEREV